MKDENLIKNENIGEASAVKKESELYEPVKRLFEEAGCQVNAEVKDCDLTAVTPEGKLIVAELKKTLSVRLLSQGLKRQKSGAEVYVAVPKPKKYSPKTFRDTLYVLKKLELGLIFVTIRGKTSFAEIIYTPLPFVPVAENRQKRAAILKEIKGRTIDTNTGGVAGKKIATAFTERNIQIACALELYGDMPPAEASRITGIEKAYSVLSMNTYKWFYRVKRGVYGLSEKGKTELNDYPELKKYYMELLKENRSGSDA